MAKAGLGRSLSNLMNGTPAGPTPEQIPLFERRPSNPIPRGLETLLKAAPQPEPSATATFEPKQLNPNPLLKIPRWFLFAADFLLLFAVAAVIWRGPNPLLPYQLLFCAAAVALGAALAILALLLPDPPQRKWAARPTPKWILAHAQVAFGLTKHYVVHLHGPVFIAEILADSDDKTSLLPVWMDEELPLDAPETRQLLREAKEFYRTASKAC